MSWIVFVAAIGDGDRYRIGRDQRSRLFLILQSHLGVYIAPPITLLSLQ